MFLLTADVISIVVLYNIDERCLVRREQYSLECWRMRRTHASQSIEIVYLMLLYFRSINAEQCNLGRVFVLFAAWLFAPGQVQASKNSFGSNYRNAGQINSLSTFEKWRAFNQTPIGRISKIVTDPRHSDKSDREKGDPAMQLWFVAWGFSLANGMTHQQKKKETILASCWCVFVTILTAFSKATNSQLTNTTTTTTTRTKKKEKNETNVYIGRSCVWDSECWFAWMSKNFMRYAGGWSKMRAAGNIATQSSRKTIRIISNDMKKCQQSQCDGIFFFFFFFFFVVFESLSNALTTAWNVKQQITADKRRAILQANAICFAVGAFTFEMANGVCTTNVSSKCCA